MPRVPPPPPVEVVVAEEQKYLFATTGTALQEQWWAAAACQDAEPDVFFPVSTQDQISRRVALSFCGGCAVRDECLRVALEDRSLIGIWGGTDEAQRAQLRQRQLVSAAS
jgi:WhiB family redox-sensing transcriptional regulator